MYSRYSKGKSVVAEIFIRTLNTKIYKHMTAVSKNVYFNVLLLINTITHIKELLKSNRKMLHLIFILNTMVILPKKILNFKLVIM